MRPCRLVLVRWFDEIVLTQTLVGKEHPDLSGVPTDESGVSVEVVEVTDDRSSLFLGVGPRFDALPPLSYVMSIAAHVAIALLLLRGARATTPEEVENDRATTLRSYLAHISAGDVAGAGPKVPPHEFLQDTVIKPASPPTPVPSEPQPVTPSRAKGRAHTAPATPLQGGTDNASSSVSVCAAPHLGPTTGPMCTRDVVVTSLTRSSPGCFTDNVVSVGQNGTVTYPCSGDGDATLRFGSTSFEGADIGGKLSVCTGTEFPWADGCTWTSAQQVTGTLESGTLHFSYGEAPKPGQTAAMCAPACSAAGTVKLAPR